MTLGKGAPKTQRKAKGSTRELRLPGGGGDHFDSPGGLPIQRPSRPENFSQDAAKKKISRSVHVWIFQDALLMHTTQGHSQRGQNALDASHLSSWLAK
jgi:hypothetical protein